jgi:polyhydroxyalkanoate synthesis regulator phasin
MCIICIDFDRGTLTAKEARRALGEMTASLDKKHRAEVEAKIEKAETEGPPSTP